MFSYKGVDSNYNYKVGTVEAANEVEAVKKIKEEEDILIVVGLNRVSKLKIANTLTHRIRQRMVEIENNVKRKRQKSKKNKKKRANKNQSMSEKSPVLRAIRKVSEKYSKKGPVKVTEEAEKQVQFIFKGTMNDYEDMIESGELTENKISYSKNVSKDDDKTGREINWELLDSNTDNDPQIISNNKLKVKEKEVIMFTRRLHIMLTSGVSLLNALTLTQETSSKNMSLILKGILEDINMGNSFSKAISKYPKVFNAAYVSLVSIGETTGELDSCLVDIIRMKEQEQKVMKKVKTASIYPGIIGLVLTVMMTAAAFFFLPKFEEMYENQNLNVPLFTEIVFSIAGMIPIFILIIVILTLTITILRKKVPKVNYAYAGLKDKLLLKVPIVKGITNALYMYYFSSTVSLMLKNGIRLSDTLSLASRSINNIYLRNEIESVGQLMIHGLSFSEALRKQDYFDDILINITQTGEESGQMTFSLTKVSEYYQGELNSKVDAMMEIIPPMSIIFIGVITAPVIVAAYLPILEISSGSGLSL